MALYYFHIRDAHSLTPDEEGIELSGMAEARAEARLSANDLAMEAMRCGRAVNSGTIEIADWRGNVLAAVAIRSSLH